MPPHATRLHKTSSGSAAGREPHLGVSPASFPFSSAQTKKVACSHETFHLKAILLEIPNFEDQFCHANTSPTRETHENLPLVHSAGERIQHGEEHSKIDCGAEKRVFNTSSMSLAQIKWKHLQFHRCPAFDTSLNHVRTRSTCVKSATPAVHCDDTLTTSVCFDGPSHTFYKRCKAIALLQGTHKQRALKPKGSADNTS